MMAKNFKVLMFGWEFPPFTSGGLGTACYGLTKGLARNGVEVIFVLPIMPGTVKSDYLKILTPENLGISGKIRFKGILSRLKPYLTSLKKTGERFGLERFNPEEYAVYGRNLVEEVRKYTKQAELIAKEEEFDIIHCHDWMTYPAGIAAKNIALSSGKNVPMIVHVHATEIDRTGGHPNTLVYNIERMGMSEADSVITVSNYTKNIVVKNYGIAPEKIRVVHNSIDFTYPNEEYNFKLKRYHKVVLFLGRMTIQKGPDHFLRVAKRVSEMDSDVIFVMGGNGDMFTYIVEEAAKLGIGDRVLFTDFLSGEELKKAYRMADVFVMTSVSEPFGITALEAMGNGTPAIISKQSGVSEVIKNCLVADFWDIDMMANYILSVLNYPELRNCLKNDGLREVSKFTWDEPAKRCISIYEDATSSIYGV